MHLKSVTQSSLIELEIMERKDVGFIFFKGNNGMFCYEKLKVHLFSFLLCLDY